MRKYPKNRRSSFRKLKVYLSIVDSIKQTGGLPKNLMPKSRLQKYVCRLIKNGYIKRIGYATYKTSIPLILPPRVTQQGYELKGLLPNEMKGCNSDNVRLHNVVFKLKVIAPLSWSSRLKDKHFKTLKNGVLSFDYNNATVWLCKRSVIVYFNPGVCFIGKTVNEALSLGVNAFFNFLPGLEELLGVGLKLGGGYVWSLDRKHLSLVKNAMAEGYNLRREKLKVFDTRGLWLMVDDSFNVNELELVRSKTNMTEAEKVQTFFNDLKKGELVTMSDIKEMFTMSATNFALLTKAIKELEGRL